jgi:hypothetical protein
VSPLARRNRDTRPLAHYSARTAFDGSGGGRMRLNPLETSPHGETLLAVVLGALLATISGVAANQFEAFFRRRERERAAALLFGEVLSTLRVILEGAERSRHIGVAYGPVTRRMLHAARREIDIYDRNREGLLDLRESRLRVELHALVVRIAMPLDGVIDSFTDPNGAEDETRDLGFEFMIESLSAVPAMVARLGRIAGHRFDHYDNITRPGGVANLGPMG